MSDQPSLRSNAVPSEWERFRRQADRVDFARTADLHVPAPEAVAPEAPLPPWVDHSVHVKYIRHQGSWGCGLNAFAACWDILLDKYCEPFLHPNISVNRLLWGHAWTLRCWPEWEQCGDRHTEPIPAPGGLTFGTLEEYLQGFGCPTEGTELTDADGVRWPTDAGDLECPSFRLGRHPNASGATLHHEVKPVLSHLKYWLAGGPVRAEIPDHFVALVGYDDSEQRVKYLNSYGDRWGEGGFGYFSYSEIPQQVRAAQVYTFVPPPPIPCARVRISSQWRQDVQLWVGVEGTTMAKRIWPSGQRQDDSANLWITVTLPPGFIWPPSPAHRVFLDVYDGGMHAQTGGDVLELSVHFNGQHRFCPEIHQGSSGPDDPNPTPGIVPRHFQPRQLVHLTIP